MAVYKFKMQGILDIKDKMEIQAKQNFANANLKLLKEEEILAEINKRIEEYLEEGKRLRNGPIDTVELDKNKIALEVLKEERIKQEREVSLARNNVEVFRKKMMDARTETRTFEKLKEKDFNEFLSEEGKKESKEIDELNSFRFAEKSRKGD